MEASSLQLIRPLFTQVKRKLPNWSQWGRIVAQTSHFSAGSGTSPQWYKIDFRKVIRHFKGASGSPNPVSKVNFAIIRAQGSHFSFWKILLNSPYCKSVAALRWVLVLVLVLVS